LTNPVTRALLKIPRHVFVPEFYQKFAYHDTPLVIGEGQTISQPYIVSYAKPAAINQEFFKVIQSQPKNT